MYKALVLLAGILTSFYINSAAHASCQDCIGNCERQFEENKQEVARRLDPANKQKYGHMALELEMPEVYLGNAVKMSVTDPYKGCVNNCNAAACSQSPQTHNPAMSEYKIQSKATDRQKWGMARTVEEIRRCTCVRERKKLNDPTCQFTGDVNAPPAGDPIPCCCEQGTFDCNSCSEMDDNCLPPYKPSVSSMFGGKDLIPQWAISNPCAPGDAECKQRKCQQAGPNPNPSTAATNPPPTQPNDQPAPEAPADPLPEAPAE